MSEFKKQHGKITRDANKKAVRFAKKVGRQLSADGMFDEKVPNHCGQDNAYRRPESKYDKK